MVEVGKDNRIKPQGNFIDFRLDKLGLSVYPYNDDDSKLVIEYEITDEDAKKAYKEIKDEMAKHKDWPVWVLTDQHVSGATHIGYNIAFPGYKFVSFEPKILNDMGFIGESEARETTAKLFKDHGKPVKDHYVLVMQKEK